MKLLMHGEGHYAELTPASLEAFLSFEEFHDVLLRQESQAAALKLWLGLRLPRTLEDSYYMRLSPESKCGRSW